MPHCVQLKGRGNEDAAAAGEGSSQHVRDTAQMVLRVCLPRRGMSWASIPEDGQPS